MLHYGLRETGVAADGVVRKGPMGFFGDVRPAGAGD